MKVNRKQLIKICEDAVVHHTKWMDRDSFLAQMKLQSIYKGLTAGLKFRIVTKEIDPEYYSDDKTYIIEFIQPISFIKLNQGKDLLISTRDEYFKDCDPDYESEMFDGDGIDFYSNYTTGYMPTREHLNNVGIGNDWY